jgi:hypothetical protein
MDVRTDLGAFHEPQYRELGVCGSNIATAREIGRRKLV